MDGNGRWANERGKSRIDGHKKGVDVVREVTVSYTHLTLPTTPYV